MNTLALLSLLAASPAPLDELIGFDQNTPQATLDDWRRRADLNRRAFLERWLKVVPEKRTRADIDAEFEMLIEFALTLDDADALTTLVGIVHADDSRRALDPDAKQLAPPEKRRAMRKHAAEFLQHTPDSEVAWRLIVTAAPDDDERVFVLKQCFERAPKLAYCRDTFEALTPRCEFAHVREQLRWLYEGKPLPPNAIEELVFKPDAPSDVLVKLAPGAPEPALFMIRTPRHDVQLFDGEKLIGYAPPPAQGEKTIVLRTVGETLDETVKLLCAKPAVTQIDP